MELIFSNLLTKYVNHSHGNITERCVLNLLYMTISVIAWYCHFLMQQYTFLKSIYLFGGEGVKSCKRLAERLA